MQITFDHVNQALSVAKSSYDISQDICLYQENCKALNSMDLAYICKQLQQSINAHGQSIKELSLLTNITVMYYQELPFHIAYGSLSYITQNIPMYVAYEQLKGKAFETLLTTVIKQISTNRL